jgi:hypothetical protein
MLTRREILCGGSLSLIWAFGSPVVCEANARRHNPIYGCTLPSNEAGAVFGSATESRRYVSGEEPMIPQSGDRLFDYALAQTLAKISEELEVLPGFAYYDDFDAQNAYATRSVKNGGADGTVLIGQRLLRRLLQADDNPDLCVAAVCAHEFGHILQYKRDLDSQLSAGQRTVRRVELQADFFAGYFAGRRKLERPDFPAAVFAQTQYNMGDDMIHQPQHHGTPAERAAAIVRGFEVAYREKNSLSKAIQVGTSYAMSL